jgi:UDP-N-acetylglucosamine 2-epimerase (non-hydrolysing)
MRAYKKYPDIRPIIVHTGQHYDINMSDTFFKELEIPAPKYNLGVGSGSHAEQTAKTMIEFEKVCLKEKPDLVVVVGDVNATIACALVASKLNIKVAHVEAGLRSNNRKMPEEINRILTDAISDYLFVSESAGMINLENEGIPSYKVYFVGNVMIDTLLYMWPRIKADGTYTRLGLKHNKYVVLTLHRPSNVDDKATLKRILSIIKNIQRRKTIVWPIHPRTKKNIEAFGLKDKIAGMKRLVITDPFGYIEFMGLIRSCNFVITDSGGIQEETTYLRKPCITMREETERPVTLMTGFNVLVGNDRKRVLDAVDFASKKKRNGFTPNFWDGKTAERIVEVIHDRFTSNLQKA